MSYENKQFIIPYSKKEEFNLFLKTINTKEELKETDNWKERHKDYIEKMWNYKTKYEYQYKCSKEEFFKSIEFLELKKWIDSHIEHL